MKVETRKPDDRQPVDATRRRLLKASAAAPLIASLAPSTAMAMASAAQCAASDFREVELVRYTVENADYTATNRRVVVHYKRNGEDLKPRHTHLTLPLELFDIDGDLYDSEGGGPHLVLRRHRNLYYEKSRVSVAEMVDVSGEKLVHRGPWPKENGSVTPLSGSCWASLDDSGLLTYN